MPPLAKVSSSGERDHEEALYALDARPPSGVGRLGIGAGSRGGGGEFKLPVCFRWHNARVSQGHLGPYDDCDRSHHNHVRRRSLQKWERICLVQGIASYGTHTMDPRSGRTVEIKYVTDDDLASRGATCVGATQGNASSNGPGSNCPSSGAPRRRGFLRC